MFTGLIEALGTVARRVPSPGGHELTISTPLASALAVGDSLAVNGVCLTVAACHADDVVTQVGPETARVTNLGGLRTGAIVNLERPVRADSRMGGHFVLGHVDGTGAVENIWSDGDFRWARIGYPAALSALLIAKGSVAVDGISLTVALLARDTFDVQIVPFTWQNTNLQARDAGDTVNLECDVLGKYVLRALDARTTGT